VVVLGLGAKAWQIGSTLVVARCLDATEADDQIAEGSQVLRRVAGADCRGILAEGDVANVVNGLDAPMAPTLLFEGEGVQLGGGTTADEQFGFFADAYFLEVMGGAESDGGLERMGKTTLLGRDFERKDLVAVMATVGLVQSEGRREKRRPRAARPNGSVG